MTRLPVITVLAGVNGAGKFLRTPEWAQPILAAAIRLSETRK